MNSYPSMAMQSIFLPKDKSLYKQLATVFAGVLLLAFASQLSIPLLPVPLTFQSVTVVLIGMACGMRYATYIVSAYLISGFVGLPVFANFSAGSTVFFGPTLGYLLGFLPAAWLGGYLAEKGWTKNILTSFATGLLSVSIIFILGVGVLSLHVGLKNAIAFGLLPFVITEIVKLLVLATIAPRFWKQR